MARAFARTIVTSLIRKFLDINSISFYFMHLFLATKVIRMINYLVLYLLKIDVILLRQNLKLLFYRNSIAISQLSQQSSIFLIVFHIFPHFNFLFRTFAALGFSFVQNSLLFNMFLLFFPSFFVLDQNIHPSLYHVPVVPIAITWFSLSSYLLSLQS